MGSGAIKNPGFDLPVVDAIFLSGSRVMVDGFETLRVLQRHGPISLRHKKGCNKDKQDKQKEGCDKADLVGHTAET